LLEESGLGSEENARRRLTVLRAIDKFDRLGLEGVAALLAAGRKDESGDFTRGAGLTQDQVDKILSFVAGSAEAWTARQYHECLVEDDESAFDDSATARYFNNNSILKTWKKELGASQSGAQAIQELSEIIKLCQSAGYGSKRIRFSQDIVRGLEYYTGPVFEAELTVPDKNGKLVSFGSVGGGGRYDGLVGRFRGENVPATGFSIGVSRLYAALKAVGSPIVGAKPEPGPVVVLALDKDQLPRYQNFVAQLRAENIRAELYLGQSGMNAQLKYADKRGSICAVIQGSNEREKGEVAIRDLVLGAELAASTKDRADYLELRAKAQFMVPEAGLVAAVREVLARHD
jgi:histidyl-tRNA synthetase